jgi:hypothetical protein
MPGPVKPCEGRFSDETQRVLNRNRDRAQWANHACEVCDLAVGAKQDRGKWIPEQHWPSVKYHSSKATNKQQEIPGESVSPTGHAGLAE